MKRIPKRLEGVARFRPHNRREKEWEQKNGEDGTGTYYIDVDKEYVEVSGSLKTRKFEFPCFDHDCSQKEFFEQTIQCSIDEFILGSDVTVLAYGQTGSGKKFTLNGPEGVPEKDNESLEGLIPRSIRRIMETVQEKQYYSMTVSCYEIYLERIRDLLSPQNNNLRIRWVPNNQRTSKEEEEEIRRNKNPHQLRPSITIENLSELEASTFEEIMSLKKRGDYNAYISSTNMGSRSSRMHTFFVLNLLNDSTGRKSRLVFVTLAGSEKVGKTRATGHRLEEAKRINQSLSAFGHVMNSQYQKRKHIPFRDSRLTRVLQYSLDMREIYNNILYMIFCCSKHHYNVDETISTLRFCQRVNALGLQHCGNRMYLRRRREYDDAKKDLRERLDFLLNEFGENYDDQFYTYGHFVWFKLKNGTRIGSVLKLLFFEELKF